VRPICFVLLTALLTFACHRKSTPRFSVDAAQIGIPKIEGWQPDPQIHIDTPEKGGIVFRLVRSNAVPGSPRIDVVIEPSAQASRSVEEFLTKNLQEMASLEASHQLRIQSVEQQQIKLGDAQAFRVRHEYTLGESLAITQVSIFTVAHGRGIAITAAGRSELFAPLAGEIAKILTGITILQAPVEKPKSTSEVPSTDVVPEDLGTIGGKK
jgi:hypothetical protein